MSLIKSAAPIESIVGQCQSCQRQLQRKSEIVDCKNGGHKACSNCTQNQGVCNNCNIIASTKFHQEYLERLNLPQLRQIMKALGMAVQNDGFQTQPIIDAILDFKNNPEAAKAKMAPKATVSNGPKVLIINKPRTNIVITETSPKLETAKKTPTTPKSPGLRSAWPPTTNGTTEQNGTPLPTPSPRKTSVNVGDYYQRQNSSKSPDIDSPKGSVSQLRATFENATNATYKPPAATSPTRKLAQNSLFQETKAEEKIEEAADHSEPDGGHYSAAETVDESEGYERATSANEEEHVEPEPEPEVDEEDRQNDNAVTENHDSQEVEAAREEEQEVEEERREEVNEEEHSEENHLQDDHQEEETPEEEVVPDYEEAFSADPAAAEPEVEHEKEEEENQEVEQNLEEQVCEIIDEATAVIENE